MYIFELCVFSQAGGGTGKTGLLPIIEYAAQHGITVSVEDYSQRTAPLALGDDLEYILTSTPNLRFTLDTGNFRCLNVMF